MQKENKVEKSFEKVDNLIDLFGEKVSLDTPVEKEEIIRFEDEQGKEDKKEDDDADVLEDFKEEEEEDDGGYDDSIVNILKEKGYVSDEELEEIKDVKDPLEYVIEKETEDKIKELLGDAPDIIKDMIRYYANGGDPYEFIRNINSNTDISNINLENEADQERIVRYKLKQDGYDDDEIQAQIEALKDTDKLEYIAKKFYDKIQKQLEAKKKEMIEMQKRKEIEEMKRMQEQKRILKNIIKDRGEVFGLTLNKKDLKELPDYMTNRNVRLSNGVVLTQMQYDLYKAMQDNEKAILIAKLLKNNFDLKDLYKKAEHKATVKIKKNLENPVVKEAKKSLADYF